MSSSDERKATPIFSGVLRYFPLALAAVARLSKAGNDKHNPGEPLHWSRDKSSDHGDCLVRHQLEFDQIDPDTGELHAVAVAWRALAQLELLEEGRIAMTAKLSHLAAAPSVVRYDPKTQFVGGDGVLREKATMRPVCDHRWVAALYGSLGLKECEKCRQLSE